MYIASNHKYSSLLDFTRTTSKIHLTKACESPVGNNQCIGKGETFQTKWMLIITQSESILLSRDTTSYFWGLTRLFRAARD